MDDFDVILGADFVTKAKAGIFHHYNDILICGGKHSYFHKVDTFLVTLQEVEGEGQKVGHPHVLSLLNEFQDIMLDKLSAKLPPRRDIEHMIELLLGECPSARDP
ncbi:unnamed protein product [Spirodela intermedia]|uniref:Uncharacterized protein n=2 Tax=Spirodela intermedia TaxID=51605 RepID=A0A7I8J0G3_SPIIN|nr:unnamed protein product [Spirodela intermedia]CAA6662800.1 unnamed protein product [Spirodela intermedia]CAA7399213.1 unnamed protein product [Spirodela intermedia]